LYQLKVENIEDTMAKTGTNFRKQMKNEEELTALRIEETTLIEKRT
jgi:hypothetical protein